VSAKLVFCTAVDVSYLPRALVLHHSLKRTGADFRLRIVCMDEPSRAIIEQLDHPEVIPFSVAELESRDPALLEVKPSRSLLEYCWTAKATLCLDTFEEEPGSDLVTYVDADHAFLSDPAPIWEELGEGSVLVVPHRSPAAERGHFNAGFIVFRRDAHAQAVLGWWRERCLEWCYDRLEDGRPWGDQGYLDEWPRRFDGVHVLEHPGGGLAPWNAFRHRLEERDGAVLVDGREVVFYHFQSLRPYRAGPPARLLAGLTRAYRVTPGREPLVWWVYPGYDISAAEVELLWSPYVRELGQAITEIRAVDSTYDAGLGEIGPADTARELVRRSVGRGRRLVGRALPER